MGAAASHFSSPRKPFSYGTKTVRVIVGKGRNFTIHEDLLCSQSSNFKKLLQPHRKDIVGICYGCAEPLEKSLNLLTFCTTCGANFHLDCQANQSNEACDSYCLTCDTVWVKQTDITVIAMKHLDADGFEAYVNWLYNGTTPEQTTKTSAIKHNTLLCKAYVVGEMLCDTDCQAATLGALANGLGEVSLGHDILGVDCIKHIYANTKRSCEMRDLIVQIYTKTAKSSWLSDTSAPLPTEFLADVLKYFLEVREAEKKKASW